MDHHGEMFLKWVRSRRVGCQFARHLASHLDEARWGGATILGKRLGDEEVTVLNAFFAESCGRFEAVHALFPDINSPSEVITLLEALCASTPWQCDEVKLDCPHASKGLLVGLRWHLPDARHVNHVLGFADFDPMPKTRRAPFTALVLRTGPTGRAPGIAYSHGAAAKRDDRNAGRCPVPVHLADMPDLLQSEERVAEVWAATSELKTKQLRGDPMINAAKAKVTFCLPAYLREKVAPILGDELTALPAAARM